MQHLSVYARTTATSMTDAIADHHYGKPAMDASYTRGGLALHVFELDGGWHWALTVERFRGVGQKVIAYSNAPFESEAQAHVDGRRAYEASRWGAQEG